jgi:hypothetical protein
MLSDPQRNTGTKEKERTTFDWRVMTIANDKKIKGELADILVFCSQIISEYVDTNTKYFYRMGPLIYVSRELEESNADMWNNKCERINGVTHT